VEEERKGKERYLVQGMRNAVGALRDVQREHLARVNDERDDARCDEHGDENGRDGVEAGPAVPLDEHRRHDHAD